MKRVLKSEPKRILVSRLRYTGDVILSTPLIEALASRFPGVEIDYLCESPHDQALLGNPYLNRIITLPGKEYRGVSRWGAYFSLLKQLSGSYDLSLDLFANPRSSLLTFLARAGMRVGGGRFPRSLAYHRRLLQGEKESTDRYFLRHLECIEGEIQVSRPRVYLSDSEKEEGRRLLEDRGIGPHSIAILSGASQASKEWPLSHYARLAAILLMGERYQPFFLGQPGKRQRLESIRDLSHSQVVILPELPFRKLAAVLTNVRALISPDGAVCHLGIALGVPTLGLFGPTDPDIWFPYTDLKHAELSIREADCRPCHLHECDRPFCMEDQSPEQVADSLSRLLERT